MILQHTKHIKPSDPVAFGYRLAGAFFGLVGLGLIAFSWLMRGTSWWMIAAVALIGLGMVIPSCGMLFARTNEAAKRSASWLLLDLLLPY